MGSRLACITAVLLAGLFAVPACNKKESPPDTAPPPQNPYTGSKGGQQGDPKGPGDQQIPNPNTGGESGLPAAPTQKPLFAATAAPQRIMSNNNLKQIGLAFHTANDVGGSFPIGIADKSGKLGLSWRVAILPYIEQDNLYNSFKLDEPWDSEHNKKLISQMPKTYSPPNTNTNGYTYYRSFTGAGTIMPSAAGNAGKIVNGLRINGIADGTANTLLVVEAFEPVIWTKPDELAFDPTKPLPKVGGGMFPGGFNALLCDGSVRFMKTSIPPATLKALITASGGEVVDID